MVEVNKMVKFLQKEYSSVRVYNKINTIGDFMEIIYDFDGIRIYYASDKNYIVIYGLTNEEFESITENGYLKRKEEK